VRATVRSPALPTLVVVMFRSKRSSPPSPDVPARASEPPAPPSEPPAEPSERPAKPAAVQGSSGPAADATPAPADVDASTPAAADASDAGPKRASYRSGFVFGSLSFFAMAGLGVIS